jgi:hypothetical protein
MKHVSLITALCLYSTASFAQSSRADLCAELINFVNKQEQQSSSQPPKEAATAVQAPSKTDRPQPGGSDQPQQSSGISGPVTHGGPGAAGPQAGAQESTQSGAPNPKADSKPPPPKDVQQPQSGHASAEAMQAAKLAGEQKDALVCRKSVQDLRRAGLDMPLDLLALGAMDPKLLSSDVQQK